ncbi:hypothetical protein R1sor_008582 [Riccia sorocarpa]|uniref:Reverse transcriptase domain-containing protein n=1 Tax=Riccia sorocarpa TaxID=122646 RepID=A0ABD3HXZ0_9MARC
MDAESLRDPVRREKIRIAWEEGWSLSPDPIIAWELAWGWARQEFKVFRKEDRLKLSKLQELQSQLEQMRGQLSANSTPEELIAYQSLEGKVREAELLEASILRRRSRVRTSLYPVYSGSLGAHEYGEAKQNRSHKTSPQKSGKSGETTAEKLEADISTVTLIQTDWKAPCISAQTNLTGSTILPGLVDVDQTGFVDGRSIMDNVVNLKLCQDLVNTTKEATIFCKLDFEKAFDRVQHEYLWDLLAAMNFNQHFISMAQMLISNGQAKVHINGRFTKTFKLQRGVRQGCPVSPLLFAISTQPLMRLFRDAERRGLLTGVTIPRGRPLLHKLFANDSGICITATEQNFECLKLLVEKFERVSGAKLNLGKSVILPMMLERSTPWLERTGCRILNNAEEEKYLGCVIGNEVGEAQHERDLAQKMQKRLTHWTNKFLQWPSKVILVKHVLKALPIYQLLGLGLPDTGYKKLEALCRTFLWGVDSNGKAKTPLIGWERLSTQRKNGGLGLRSFKDTSDSLKMRYVGRMLQGETSEWANILRFLIHNEMKKRARGSEYRWWTPEEGVLLLPEIPSPKNSAARHLIQAWKRGWKDLKAELSQRRIHPTALQLQEVESFQTWLLRVRTDTPTLQNSSSWIWKGDSTGWKGWQRPAQFWNKLLTSKESPEVLSNKWTIGGQRFTWAERWRHLWKCRGTLRSKLWVWRVLKHGFFTGERAERMGVSNDPCRRCGRTSESISHLFWSCSQAELIWDKLRNRSARANSSFRIHGNILDTIDEALYNNKRGGTLLQIMAAALQAIWKDRNSKIFRNQDTTTPIELILNQARWEIEGDMNSSNNPLAWTANLQKLQEITSLLDANITTPRVMGSADDQRNNGVQQAIFGERTSNEGRHLQFSRTQHSVDRNQNDEIAVQQRTLTNSLDRTRNRGAESAFSFGRNDNFGSQT